MLSHFDFVVKIEMSYLLERIQKAFVWQMVEGVGLWQWEKIKVYKKVYLTKQFYLLVELALNTAN